MVEQLVRRAERAGFKAIALTVDTPILGRRESDIKNRYESRSNWIFFFGYFKVSSKVLISSFLFLTDSLCLLILH